MNKPVIRRLFKSKEKNNSTSFKIISLIAGVVIFLGILPGLFILIGIYFKDNVWESIFKIFESVMSILGITIGSFFLVWATVIQWKTGKGTPAPNAPPQFLVISGPYKYCRNPIELGAIFYYLGIGTLFGGIVVGVICFILGFTVGSFYNLFFEEKELEKRFGEEYIRYRETTPFIIPRVYVSHKEHKEPKKIETPYELEDYKELEEFEES